MPQPTLPTEIWEQTTLEMTIDDIVALSLTSHALHDIISSSLFVWRAVIEDLLLISPNSLLSRSLHMETPQMLRTKAIRFSNAQKTLSRNDPALLQSVSTLRMPMGQRNVHPCILPGTPYALYLSEDRTGDCLNLHAIHVISMATGYVHDTCRLQAASVRNMDVYHSATYGMVVVLKYFARQGTHILREGHAVQLLQVLVDDTSHPRLETLFVFPSPKVQARSDLPIPSQSIDDTFAVRDNDSGELVMIHIPSAVDAFREDTPIPTTRWVSPDMFGNYWHMSYPQMVCILTSDVLLVRLDHTRLGFIRLRPGPASSPLDMTPEPCTLEVAGAHNAGFHSQYSTGSTFHIDLKAGTRIIAISIARDLLSMSLDSSWDTRPPPIQNPSRIPPH